MNSKEKFIRVITENDGEEVLAIDAIESISRRENGATIIMKSGAEYYPKGMNLVLDVMERFIASVEEIEPEKDRQDYLLEEFGITVESQPQFINIVEKETNKVINVNTIKKIEPDGNKTHVTLIGDSEPMEFDCHIREIVDALANVVPVDAVKLRD